MRSIIKYLFWGLGGLFILAFVAVAAFALLFDPNAMRDDITRVVEKKTGRSLEINGDLSLSFYPWLGFAAGKTTLSNAPGYTEAHMVSFDSASASVKLLPLLKRRIELSRVTLDGVDLNLHRKADGTSNWDDLAALRGADTSKDPGTAGAGFSADGVGGIHLTNARVAYIDETEGVSYTLRELDLTTGALRPRSVFPLEAKGYVVSLDPGVEGPATIEGEVQVDSDGTVYLAKPRMTIEAKGDSVPGDRMNVKLAGLNMTYKDELLQLDRPELNLSGTGGGDPWTSMEATLSGEKLVWTGFDVMELSTPVMQGTMRSPDIITGGMEGKMTGTQLRASIEKETFSVTAANAEALGLKITSDELKASDIFDDMILRGRIEIAEFAPRPVLVELGMGEIDTADPKALSTMRLSGEAYYGPDAMRLSSLTGKLDQSTLSGSLAMLSNDQMQFDLTIDEINMDRYREPSATDTAADNAAGLEEVDIPVESLRELAMDGKLRVGKMQLVGLKTTDVNLAIKAAAGDVRAGPVTASLYGGKYNGDIRLDVRGELPKISLNERLENVQFGPFSKDLLNAERISGTLNGRITGSGTGSSASAITASANGDGVFAFADGAYEGTDIWYRVRKARSLITGGTPPEAPAVERTPFANLSGTAKITDGVMRSDDISMVLPFMKVKGSGNLELLSQKIDFRFSGDIVDRPDLTADVNDLVGITVPLKVTGTVSAPSIGVDMKEVLATLAKRKLGKKLGLGDDAADQTAAAKDAVDKEKEELKEKLDDKLKDKLKGLFGGGGN